MTYPLKSYRDALKIEIRKCLEPHMPTKMQNFIQTLPVRSTQRQTIWLTGASYFIVLKPPGSRRGHFQALSHVRACSEQTLVEAASDLLLASWLWATMSSHIERPR